MHALERLVQTVGLDLLTHARHVEAPVVLAEPGHAPQPGHRHRLHQQAAVVLHADEVPVHPHRGVVARLHVALHPPDERRHVDRVAEAGVGLQEDPVGEGVDHRRPLAVAGRVLGGAHGRDDVGGAHVRVGGVGPHGLGPHRLAEVHVVGGGQRRVETSLARRVHPGQVAAVHEAARLVEDHPVAHPVAEVLGHQCRVLAEPADHVSVGPTAAVLEGLGEVPVVERQPGFDAPLEVGVDQAGVEVEPGLVHPAGARGQDPRPRHREPLGTEAQFAHQVGVGLVAVVVVAGHVGVAAVADLAGAVGEGVPDGPALAVGVPGPLHLVRGVGHPPGEVGSELAAGQVCHGAMMAHAGGAHPGRMFLTPRRGW